MTAEKSVCPMCEMDDLLESATRWSARRAAMSGALGRSRASSGRASSGLQRQRPGRRRRRDADQGLRSRAPADPQSGTKSKPIRWLRDHELACKMTNHGLPEAAFVKKA